MSGQDGSLSFYLAGNGTMTIDWGIGTEIETYTLNKDDGLGYWLEEKYYYRTDLADYPVKSNSITITGEITLLGCGQWMGITNLDVSQNTALTYLVCTTNRGLKSLDVSNNTALTYLDCSDDGIKRLDVSKNTALTYLGCSANPLGYLNVSSNTALTHLECMSIQLSSLDLSKNTKLKTLHCGNNQFSADELNALFGTLHENDVANKTVNICGNPGTADCDPSIATAKGWKVDSTTF
jgi:hypothetical protein